MTNAEAKAVLNEMIISKIYELEVEKSKKGQKAINEQGQALNIAIEAVEKQIPKKVVGDYRCPYCRTYNDTIKKRKNTVSHDVCYCWHCGQALNF